MTWSAKITMAEGVYFYSEDATDPNIAIKPGYKVYFRPDEIVFHWGTAGDKSVTPAHLDPYTAEVFKDGVSVATYSVPVDPVTQRHWWASRWLHEITPDSIVRSPAQMRAENLFIPFGDTSIPSWSIPAQVFKGPMDSAGERLYEPTTGEDAWIGIANDYAAMFCLTGEAGSFLQVGKASFSKPMFWTDERTGKPWDILKEPTANCYYDHAQGDPWMGPFPPALPDGSTLTPWSLDGAHAGEDEGLIYFATGLDRHLEALQYRTVAMFLEDSIHSGMAGFAVCAPAQTRKTAWTLRNLALTIKATELREAQGALPDYLQPSSYFQQILANQLAWFTKSYMNDPGGRQVFRCWPDDRSAFWQQDYLLTALSLLAMWWPADWSALYLWSLGSIIARTNGKSGWPPAYPTTYYAPLFSDSSPAGPGKNWFPDWGTAWKTYAANQIAGTDVYNNNGQLVQADIDLLTKDQYNGNRYVHASDYQVKVHAVLAFAVYLDRNKIVDVSGTYPELEDCYASQHQMAVAWGRMQYRWSISPDIDPPSAVTITAPTQTPPASTGSGGSSSSGSSTPPPQTSNLPTPVNVSDPSIFDAVSPLLNLQTDQDEVLVDLTGQAITGNHVLVFNLQGNGDTRVTVIWPGIYGDWVTKYPVTAKNGALWVEDHGSGDSFVLYNCGTSLIVNGAQIGTAQPDPASPPTTDPTQSQEPTMSDAMTDLTTAVNTVSDTANRAIAELQALETQLASAVAAANAANSQIDPAQIEALVTKLNTTSSALAAELAKATTPAAT